MTRIWNVVRLHFVNRMTFVTLPWIILGSAFAITVGIWLILRSAGIDTGSNGEVGGAQFSGALLSILCYLLVAAVMAINLTFPFALGFSVTRRDFYLGTALTFVLVSAANAVLLSLLAVIERATNGWGVNGRMFTALWPGGTSGNPLELWFGFFAVQLLFCFIGAAIATVYMRWRINGMVVFWVIGGLALLGGLALIVYTDGWAAIGRWIAESGTTGLAAWSLPVSALAALAGFFVLRKATPKN